LKFAVVTTECNGPENMFKARKQDSYSLSQRPRQRQAGQADSDWATAPYTTLELQGLTSQRMDGTTN
jgi:hypothetical protein